ncbi:AAA family ATPase [Cupriavidus sp. SW-Y-13]|nr:ATP-binding sensor histidine kinase [Cupriavidus sp. SW-Y-13]MWL91364.1 AAA family ATPase [Cupriavidus sp. SW-Y-13]
MSSIGYPTPLTKPRFDEAWLERCARVRLFAEGEIVWNRVTDRATNTTWITASARWSAGDGCRRLERESELVDRLHPNWAVAPVETIRTADRLVLLYSDTGHSKLESIAHGVSLSIDRFLRIAIGATHAVAEAHARDLLHRDIRSATLVDAGDGRILLASFGYAADLLGDTPPAAMPWNHDAIAYAAPEQARVHHPYSDQASDLYSLGVVLYKLLTGMLPLRADSNAAWLHAHVAVQPVRPNAVREMPAQLSELVLKLIAKDPADRYQNAQLLQADLLRCQSEWERLRDIPSFELGLSGAPRSIARPQCLFGRAAEMDLLTAAFERVALGGHSELVLVSGAPGAGKSALVDELTRASGSYPSRSATGKSDQQQRDIPFAPVAQMLRSLTVRLLSGDNVSVTRVRERLAATVGAKGQLLVDLVPEIAHVIGPCPALPELPVPQALIRAHRTILQGLSAFALDGLPLILFLDDLQWADDSTLALLSAFTNQPPEGVLLVGSYRNHDLGLLEQMGAMLSSLRSSAVRMTEIEVRPLSVPDVSALVAAMLNRQVDDVGSLANVVHEKAAGNPFFIYQLLRSLADEGVVRFDSDAGEWTWDSAEAMRRRYSDNVIDLMIRRLDRLSVDGREILRQLACIGHRVDGHLLARVAGVRPAQLQLAVQSLVDAGLLLRDGRDYVFPHDRVLEAGYALTPSSDRPGEHARIAAVMIDLWPEAPSEVAFEIANQIERAMLHNVSSHERVQFAGALLVAARRARKAAAIDQAVSYLEAASGMVELDWWTDQYPLAVAISMLHCECLLSQARLDAAASEIEALLHNAVQSIDKAAAYRLKATLQTINSEYEGAISAALAGLTLLGIELRRSASPEQVRQAYEDVKGALDGRPIAEIEHLPIADDKQIEVAMGLLSTLISSFFVNDELCFFHVAKMVELTLKHGATQDSAYGFAWFGVKIAHLYEAYEEGLAYGEVALRLARRLNNESGHIAALVAVDQMSPWTQPLSSALARIREAGAAARAVGDVPMQCYAFNHLISDLTAMGEHLGYVQDEIRLGLELTRRVQYKDVELILTAQQAYVRGMRHGPSSLGETDGEHQAHTGRQPGEMGARSMSTVFLMHLYEGMSAFFLGDAAHAVECLALAESLEWAMPAHINACDCLVFGALAQARVAHVSGNREEAVAFIVARRARLARWAELNPATFRGKLLLVDGELARLLGEDVRAMQCFEQSASASAVASFVHEQALAHEAAALHCDALELKTSARQHVRMARDCYRRWGANYKVSQLETHYPFLAEEVISDPASSDDGGQAALDLEVGIKAAQALSEEVVLDRLIETLMSNMIVHAGAQYGLLLLMRDGSPLIEATGRVQGSHVAVTLGTLAPTADVMSLAVLNNVVRTGRTLVISDAQAHAMSELNAESATRVLRSVICLPLVKRGTLIGVLYLENNLAPDVFTPSRTAMLEVLAPQAAISLETARLYAELIDENARRAKSEAALASARAELARTSHLTVMGGLAASIAHEINQPLGAIISCVDASLRWLQRATPDIGEALGGLNQIRNDGLRAAEIVRALRSLAKQAPAALGAMVVDDVIHDVASLTRADIEAHQVNLITRLDAAKAIVIGDRIQVQQVVLNLISNAIDAMRETPPKARELIVSSTVDTGYVVVSVQDTGTGIAAGTLARIFDPFFTTKETGMGMGLVICRSIMEAQGGTLEAFSTEGLGSMFVFRLPMATEAQLAELESS